MSLAFEELVHLELYFHVVVVDVRSASSQSIADASCPTSIKITLLWYQSLLLLKKSGCVVVLQQINQKVYSLDVGMAFSFM